MLFVLDYDTNVPTAYTFWTLFQTSYGAGNMSQLALYIVVRCFAMLVCIAVHHGCPDALQHRDLHRDLQCAPSLSERSGRQ